GRPEEPRHFLRKRTLCGFPAYQAGRSERNRNPPIGGGRGEARSPCRHTIRNGGAQPAREPARTPAAARGECRTWDQAISASNDLRGGSSGIASPRARDKRPRQNSQERSLSHPGWASRITAASLCAPSVVSNRRISSNVP